MEHRTIDFPPHSTFWGAVTVVPMMYFGWSLSEALTYFGPHALSAAVVLIW